MKKSSSLPFISSPRYNSIYNLKSQKKKLVNVRKQSLNIFNNCIDKNDNILKILEKSPIINNTKCSILFKKYLEKKKFLNQITQINSEFMNKRNNISFNSKKDYFLKRMKGEKIVNKKESNSYFRNKKKMINEGSQTERILLSYNSIKHYHNIPFNKLSFCKIPINRFYLPFSSKVFN
jgi:hypothetical protein